MKRILLLIVLVSALSCKQKITEADLSNLNGYWEIEKVELPDGDKKEYKVNEGYLSQARFVLRHCRDKAEEVLRNAKYPLTVAYEEAQAIVRLIHRSHLSTIRCIKTA